MIKINEDLITKINNSAPSLGEIRLMEVCGTHTVSIHKFAIPSILPASIKLISGPGCPICVTEQAYIDKAIEYLKKDYKVFTFGDIFRVPGSRSSLEKESSNKIKIVYSLLDALEYAKKNSRKKYYFWQ